MKNPNEKNVIKSKMGSSLREKEGTKRMFGRICYRFDTQRRERRSSRVLLLTPCSIARKKPNNSLHSKGKSLAKKYKIGGHYRLTKEKNGSL
jgi:hypothetical protein